MRRRLAPLAVAITLLSMLTATPALANHNVVYQHWGVYRWDGGRTVDPLLRRAFWPDFDT